MSEERAYLLSLSLSRSLELTSFLSLCSPLRVSSVCANRIFVQEAVYDTFAQKLAIAVRAFQVGEGAREGVTHGPLIHRAAVEKVERHVADAVGKGAKVLVGGKKMERSGYFFQVCHHSLLRVCGCWACLLTDATPLFLCSLLY